MDATEINAKNKSEENAARLLNDMLLDFAARYAPAHPRDRDHFNAAMTTVVRQVTLDAHRVYGDQLTKLVSGFYHAAPLHVLTPGNLERIDRPDLKPGNVVYQQGPEMVPLQWSVFATDNGVPHEWAATRLGFTYLVKYTTVDYHVSRDGHRIGRWASLELAQEKAFDDCNARVLAALKCYGLSSKTFVPSWPLVHSSALPCCGAAC